MPKLDSELAQLLRDFLKQNNISAKRIVIDIESETFEVESQKEIAGIPDNQHILDLMGILNEEEAKKINDEVRKERDEWD